MIFGKTFGSELRAAGIADGLSWKSDTGSIFGRENLTSEQNTILDQVIAAHDPSAVPPLMPGQVVTYPGEFWMRCTEAEAETIAATAATMSIRDQQIFQRATVFDHAVPETQQLLQLLTAAFGATRANELLAPSST